MYVVMTVFIYAAVSLYLGKKFSGLWPNGCRYQKRPVYWIIVWCSIGLVFLQRWFGIGLLIYLVMAYAVSDVICFLCQWNKKTRFVIGWVATCLAGVVSVYGFVNANRIKLTSYEVSMNISQEISLIMISDVHLGTAVTVSDLSEIVNRINALAPNLICICGDLYDERTTKEELEASYEILGRLEASYGVYYVEGNHEVSMKEQDKIMKQMQNHGITVLLDQTVLIDQKFYLAGRRDRSDHFQGKNRKTIPELLMGTNSGIDVIILDHQPCQINEASLLGADLMLSGHTHAGQIIPANLFSAALNEQNYGAVKYGSMTSITSSGLGTWGFVLRTCKHSEIVLIHILPHDVAG